MNLSDVQAMRYLIIHISRAIFRVLHEIFVTLQKNRRYFLDLSRLWGD